MLLDYAVAGTLTGLDAVPTEALATVAADAMSICSPVHALVVQPTDTDALGLPEERLTENQIRPVGELVTRLLALDPAPLNVGRDPGKRVVGTCRHFAVLSCALLRYRGIAARVRCGFATYFQHGHGVDHWITEYRDNDPGRGIRVDPEVLGQAVVDHPEDLEPGQFLTGGEAWLAFRRGDIDASLFGVYGTENWGPGEIRGNAVKDLAALNKVEMLPWDEWGRMTDAYDGKTGADYDDLLDTLATVCATDDPGAVTDLYTHEDLRVPAELIL
ncbi:MAG: transglutaminase domain-containing protein [Acidimicrobiales bacterium]